MAADSSTKVDLPAIHFLIRQGSLPEAPLGQKRLWHLRGRVCIRNNDGLHYESEELFYDGIRHELYSNVFSRVTTPERTMEGTYFLSDEHLRHYTVSNSKGAFSREDMTGEKTDEEETKDPKDTIKVEPYVRPQTQKHRRIAP